MATKKTVVGKTTKSPKKAKAAETPVLVPVSELTAANKEYITTHFNKLATAEIALNTGLTEQQVLDYVHNAETTVKNVRKKGKYGSVKGESAIFDEAKSAAADLAFRNSPKTNYTGLGKDLVPIVFKEGFNVD